MCQDDGKNSATVILDERNPQKHVHKDATVRNSLSSYETRLVFLMDGYVRTFTHPFVFNRFHQGSRNYP